MSKAVQTFTESASHNREPELKPCRCGGEAELRSKYLWASGGWGKSYTSYYAKCTKCGVRGKCFNTIDHVNAKQKAIDAWNRRCGEGEKG